MRSGIARSCAARLRRMRGFSALVGGQAGGDGRQEGRLGRERVRGGDADLGAGVRQEHRVGVLADL